MQRAPFSREIPVYEITQHSRDNSMILATHGRAIWILDDMTPFQDYAKAQSADAFVFASKGGTLRLPVSEQERSFQGDMLFMGENPPFAAPITYVVKTKPDSVRIVIRDGAGATLRGDCTAVVYVIGKEIGATTLGIRKDPESQISDADRRANFDLQKELHTLNGRLTEAVTATRQANTQLAAILATTDEVRKEVPTVVDEANALINTFAAFVRQLADAGLYPPVPKVVK